MKKGLFILLTGLLSISSSASSGINGQVKGRVIDALDGSSFENVTVAVYSMPDSAITTGVVTDKDGFFVINNLPAGEFNLVVTFVGFKSKSLRFYLSEETDQFDVGEIVLAESTESLGEVSVIAVKPQIIYRDNKKILKVREFQDAGASNLAEVLENAPSVTLDADGNVLLRGSGNYTLLIDGKPMPGTGVNMMRQIPPEMVEDIEIMTNPSAKYDPDGVTGIINLVLKKQGGSGLNSQLTAMAGLKGKYNGDLQTNYRKEKTNIFAGVTLTSYKTAAEGEIYRETGGSYSDSEILNELSQETQIKTVVGNLGIDYTLNEKNSFTLSGRFGPQNISAYLDNRIIRSLEDVTQSGNYNFSNDLHLDGFFYVPNLTWDHILNKEGSRLQTNIFVGGFQGVLAQDMIEEEMDPEWNPTGVISDRKRVYNQMDINDIRAKTDYENSIGDKGKLEAGYQYRRLIEKNEHSLDYYNINTLEWIGDADFTNDFVLDRTIHSVYMTWGGDLGKYNYQLGLRGEFTDRLVEQQTTGSNYTYSKINFFPSGNITRKFNETMQIQFSYSRRINRPGRFQLNPFLQYADNQLVVTGNPLLNPEFIDSYELSFQDQVKAGFLSVEGYYRRVNDMMTNNLAPGDDGVIIQSFVNANRSHSTGTELMANLQPVNWLRVIASGNVYYYILDDEIIYEENDNSSLIWTSNLTSVFLPTKTTRLTLSAIYNGPSINLQGTQKASYMINMGIRQEMFKRKTSLALSVRDLFKTFVIENEVRGEEFSTTTIIQSESQVVTLTFTYNFNNYRQRARQDDMELNFIR